MVYGLEHLDNGGGLAQVDVEVAGVVGVALLEADGLGGKLGADGETCSHCGCERISLVYKT